MTALKMTMGMMGLLSLLGGCGGQGPADGALGDSHEVSGNIQNSHSLSAEFIQVQVGGHSTAGDRIVDGPFLQGETFKFVGNFKLKLPGASTIEPLLGPPDSLSPAQPRPASLR